MIFNNSKAYTLQNGAALYRIENVPSADDIISTLLVEGYDIYHSHSETGNCFADLYCEMDDTQIHISHFAGESELILIKTKGEALPPKQEETVLRITTPLITQVKLAYCRADCGMSYLIRLCDGRFVVIDGGYDEYEEYERLYSFIQEQNVLSPKPKIAAWFITHAHDDHFGCFARFVERYIEKIDFEYLAFNWATKEMCPYLCDHTAADNAAELLKQKGCKIITPHTGQRLCFADAVFDILFACEDLLPNGDAGFNNTSLVMRMELNGRRTLWLGDTEPPACKIICRHFPRESLECELLQVGHHGYNGGSPELYQMANPVALLWPCPDYWFHVVREWDANRFLITSPKIEQTYLGGRYSTVLDMTLPLSQAPIDPCYSKGDVIAQWDMDKISRVIDLNWSCIWSIPKGYKPPVIYFDNGSCTVDAQNTVCFAELLRPGLLEDASSYEMTLEGSLVENNGKIGVACNEAKPTAPNMDNILFFDADCGEHLSLRLSVSGENSVISLDVNGKNVCSAPYTPAIRRGLYLYFDNAVLSIEGIRVVR